ncbi:MAG: endonuclease III [Chloroflexota bacterium]
MSKDKERTTFRIRPDFRKEEVQRASEAIDRLREIFPDVACSLKYETPFQLLVGAIILTQSTEQDVNQVTKRLFNMYDTPEAIISAPRGELEALIKPTGFYRQKAKYLQETSRILIDKFDGVVPDNLLELTQLPGVARKIANLVLGELYQEAQGIQVDTLDHRVATRLHLSGGKITSKVEHDLMRVVEQHEWIDLPYLFTALATKVCYSKRPACHMCPLADICPSNGE